MQLADHWQSATSMAPQLNMDSHCVEYTVALDNPQLGVVQCGAYNTVTKGTYYRADYARLRTNSQCDPFVGAPIPEGEMALLPELNNPFGESNEDNAWMETFIDLAPYEGSFEDNFVEVVDQAAADVDWDQWDRFLSSSEVGRPTVTAPQLGSTGSSPQSTYYGCDDYVPNFATVESLNGDVKSLTSANPPESQDASFIGTGLNEPIAFGPSLEVKPFSQVRHPNSTDNTVETPKVTRRVRPVISRPKPKLSFNPIAVNKVSSSSDQRRRELNRDAAHRYRERKKQEKEALCGAEQELEDRNRWLSSRVDLLTKEIQRMRNHLHDLGAF